MELTLTKLLCVCGCDTSDLLSQCCSLGPPCWALDCQNLLSYNWKFLGAFLQSTPESFRKGGRALNPLSCSSLFLRSTIHSWVSVTAFLCFALSSCTESVVAVSGSHAEMQTNWMDASTVVWKHKQTPQPLALPSLNHLRSKRNALVSSFLRPLTITQRTHTQKHGRNIK